MFERDMIRNGVFCRRPKLLTLFWSGLGAMGGIVAPVFAKAGLKVVAIETGPWRTNSDYLPDELGATYYCRANMGSKFMREIPRWRRNADEPTRGGNLLPWADDE